MVVEVISAVDKACGEFSEVEGSFGIIFTCFGLACQFSFKAFQFSFIFWGLA